MNENIHITCAIIKQVAASVAEADLGALFLNTYESGIIRLCNSIGARSSTTPTPIDRFIHKVKGAENLSNPLTKYVNGIETNQHIEDSGMRIADGRHELAPQLGGAD